MKSRLLSVFSHLSKNLPIEKGKRNNVTLRFDPNEKNKHKFMVQSMFAPDGEINQDTLVSC